MTQKFIKNTLAFSVLAAISLNLQAQESQLINNEPVKLKTIIVTTAGGYEQNIADAPASISVITAEE